MKINDLEYYDLNADKWWNENEVLYLSNHLNHSIFKFFSKFVPHWEGLEILYIGCGVGLASKFVANLNACVSAIDLSLNSIKILLSATLAKQLKKAEET